MTKACSCDFIICNSFSTFALVLSMFGVEAIFWSWALSLSLEVSLARRSWMALCRACSFDVALMAAAV